MENNKNKNIKNGQLQSKGEKYWLGRHQGTKKYNLLFVRQLFIKKVMNPVFIVIYVVAWIFFYKLCKYGMLNKYMPIIYSCIIFFMAYFIVSTIEYVLYYKNEKESIREINSNIHDADRFIYDICIAVKVNTDRVVCNTECDEFSFSIDEIIDVAQDRKWLYLFLKKRRFVVIKRESIDLCDKAILRQIFAKQTGVKTTMNRILCLLLIAAITFSGIIGVYSTTQHFSGKLAWVLDSLNTRRRVTLVDDNVFLDGFGTIFEQIREKGDLPHQLMVANGFELDFLPDGTVDCIETLLYGFDDTGAYVNTYTISYNREKDEKITINLSKTKGVLFSEERDFERLKNAMEVLPLEETVRNWNKGRYGILYYGERKWKYSDAGIYFINHNGEIWRNVRTDSEELTGKTISVFCPDDDRVVLPVRYIFQ